MGKKKKQSKPKKTNHGGNSKSTSTNSNSNSSSLPRSHHVTTIAPLPSRVSLGEVSASGLLTLGINPGPLTPSSLALLLTAFPDGERQWSLNGGAEEKEAARRYVASAVQASPGLVPTLPFSNEADEKKHDPRGPMESCDTVLAVAIYTDMEGPKRVLAAPSTDTSDETNLPKFAFVNDPNQATFHLITSPISNFLGIDAQVRVCQFPYEGGLVRKDLIPLAIRTYCYREPGVESTRPNWWLPCFDLRTEFHLFLDAFDQRCTLNKGSTGCGSHNVWIIKPAIGTHGVGHVIVTSPFEAAMAIYRGGGKDFVAQLLVENPCCAVPRQLWQSGINSDTKKKHLRKFDFRVFVVVRSFHPKFEAYRHTHLYARLAPKPYYRNKEIGTADENWDDGVHITTSSARDSYDYFAGERPDETLLECDGQDRLLWDEFAEQLKDESCLDDFDPNEVLLEIDKMLAEVFGRAGSGIVRGPWPRSSAYYGCDVMLSYDEGKDGNQVWVSPRPKLLEVNFMADWDVAILAGAQAGRKEEVRDWAKDILMAMATDDDLTNHPRLMPLNTS